MLKKISVKRRKSAFDTSAVTVKQGGSSDVHQKQSYACAFCARRGRDISNCFAGAAVGKRKPGLWVLTRFYKSSGDEA